MKKSVSVFLVFTIIFAFASQNVFARKKTDVVEKDVSQKESWKESFDLTKSKSGKYNVVVTAEDFGGNKGLAGPFNIYVDPESDLPVSGITNPLNNMRIPGNLNIVGTCIDDDGVDRVELILDGDKDNPVKAIGTEFWSYYLDTQSLPEGPHTIEVYGVDINGLRGKSKTVTWNLDRRQPSIQVSNIGLGQLVSGKVNFEGTISDGNGIKSLTYSIDNGAHFYDARISEKKYGKDEEKADTSIYTFSVPVDTRVLKDGPTVIWFKATDTMNSVGLYSFLYNIDNTEPEVNIFYPEEKQECFGVFTVAGTVKDVVGIEKLTWEFNGEKGDFELIPGNPYWSKEVNTINIKSKSADFIITATDRAGNVVSHKKTILLNQELDKPVLTIESPVSGSVFTDKDFLFIRGIASAGDGIYSVTYSIDNGEKVESECEGVFYIPVGAVKDFPSGKHVLSVSAKDVHGVSGNPVSVEYVIEGRAPEFSAAEIKYDSKVALEPEKVVPGMVVNPESGGVFSVAAESETGLKRASWRMEWGAGQSKTGSIVAQKAPEKKMTISIPVSEMPWGVVRISVEAEDAIERVSQQKSVLYVKNLSRIYSDDVFAEENVLAAEESKPADGEMPEAENQVSSDASNSDTKESVSDEQILAGLEDGELPPLPEIADEPNKIVSIGEKPYYDKMFLTFDRNEVSAVKIELESDKPVTQALYKLESKNSFGGNGNQSGKAILKVNPEDKTKYTVEIPFANIPAGELKIELSTMCQKIAGPSVKGRLFVVRKEIENTDDRQRIYWVPRFGQYDVLEERYLLKGGDRFEAYANVDEPVSVAFAEPEKSEGLNVVLEGKVAVVTVAKDGKYDGVKIVVTDKNGQEFSSAAVNIFCDSGDPKVELIGPDKQIWVQNSVVLTVVAEDISGIASVEYSFDNGSSWNELAKTDDIYMDKINLEALPDGLVSIDIRVKDGTGQVSYTQTAIQKDTTPPEVEVVMPQKNDIVNGDNYIAFLVKDNGKFVRAQYFAPVDLAAVDSKSSDKKSAKEKVEEVGIDIPLSSMVTTQVGNLEKPISDLMRFDFTDAAGNVTQVRQWEFIIDAESDLPRAEVHLPEENAVVTRDVEISGVIFDDDGNCKLWYKIDDEEYRLLSEDTSSFSLVVPLKSITDNEHSITVFAEDIHGVKGPEFVRKFRVSKGEPRGEVLKPSISDTVNGSVTLQGAARDENGIGKVLVSLDNGNSFNEAVGEFGHDKKEAFWSYTFDTRAIQDGTHVVFLRIIDDYGIEGLYSSLINIDNTAPEITLELPLDGSKTTGPVFISGYTSDNIGLTDLYITVRSLDGKPVSQAFSKFNLEAQSIITETLDFSVLDNGFYNVEFTGKDAGNNITRISRNIQVDKNSPAAKLDLLYPMNGESVAGVFNIYGTGRSESNDLKNIVLFVDGEKALESELSDTGYFRFQMGPENLTDGKHTVQAQGMLANGDIILSPEQTVIYTSAGPWVTIDNFTYGDFAVERPYLIGDSGYAVAEEEILAARKKDATREFKDYVAGKSVSKVEISFNNGKSFQQVSKSGKWRYRIEPSEMHEGYHFLLVRSTMKNGEVAVTRTIVQIDKKAPVVRLISPGEGGHYNQTLEFSGLTNDDVALKRVTLALRKGDKTSYEIPSFIQGLYFDWQFWGASLFNIGAGLTFFDSIVKVQFQWGQFTKDQWKTFNGGTESGYRYGGDSIIGIKLLANVLNVPFSFFFGPNASWLSANVAVGANFSFFSDSAANKGQFLSALLLQLEFPRIKLEKQKIFRNFAFYTEGQFWFCPSDVIGTNTEDVPTIVPQISFGIRVNVF